jgi:hypothetical protein
VFAQTARYELFPEPDVRQTATNRSASAYVVDKKNNQFWICTARYNFRDLTANSGDCVELPLDIGRPSISETYNARPVIGSAPISAFLPDLVHRTSHRGYAILRHPARRILRAVNAAPIGFDPGATAASAIWKSKQLMDVICALSP